MTNSSDRNIYNSEDRQESYNDANGDTHTYVKRTTGTINNDTVNPDSYGVGYVDGQNTERRYQQSNLAERDHHNAAGSLLLGIILTSLASLIAIGFWYINQRQNTAPVETPAPSPTAQAPNPQTTIIERTREVPIPVAPTTAPSPPQINITVPSQPPTNETTPKETPSPNTPTTNTPVPENNSETSPQVEGTGTSNSDQ
ncbi:MAG: hypothetical protein KME23_10710 [Goleter apudmare HA4340-LM2]|jgi:hypothetical protein|nr:hypothetical protein [Goleter apudmare HA4340-LM2]